MEMSAYTIEKCHMPQALAEMLMEARSEATEYVFDDRCLAGGEVPPHARNNGPFHICSDEGVAPYGNIQTALERLGTPLEFLGGDTRLAEARHLVFLVEQLAPDNTLDATVSHADGHRGFTRRDLLLIASEVLSAEYSRVEREARSAGEAGGVRAENRHFSKLWPGNPLHCLTLESVFVGDEIEDETKPGVVRVWFSFGTLGF